MAGAGHGLCFGCGPERRGLRWAAPGAGAAIAGTKRSRRAGPAAFTRSVLTGSSPGCPATGLVRAARRLRLSRYRPGRLCRSRQQFTVSSRRAPAPEHVLRGGFRTDASRAKRSAGCPATGPA